MFVTMRPENLYQCSSSSWPSLRPPDEITLPEPFIKVVQSRSQRVRCKVELRLRDMSQNSLNRLELCNYFFHGAIVAEEDIVRFG